MPPAPMLLCLPLWPGLWALRVPLLEGRVGRRGQQAGRCPLALPHFAPFSLPRTACPFIITVFNVLCSFFSCQLIFICFFFFF